MQHDTQPSSRRTTSSPCTGPPSPASSSPPRPCTRPSGPTAGSSPSGAASWTWPTSTKPTPDYWDRNVQFTTGVVFVEDFRQQETIHANLRSGLLPELIYGRNEPGLIHFHQALAAALNNR